MPKKSVQLDNLHGSVYVGGNMQGDISNRVTGSFNTTELDQNALDLEQLAHELALLRTAMKQVAKQDKHDIVIGEIAKAEQSAKSKDFPKVKEHLKSAGEWALEVATKIGASLAVDILKQAIGIK